MNKLRASNGWISLLLSMRRRLFSAELQMRVRTKFLHTGWRQSFDTMTLRGDKVFIDIPLGIPPHRGFEHTIELEAGAKPVITTPYHHPKKFEDEIEKTIQELLEKGWICPSSSPFASSMVLVKKNGTMRMCVDYRALKKKQ